MATKLEILTSLARRAGIRTLESRGSDKLDFHEVGVWQLRALLEAAFQAGIDSVTPRAEPVDVPDVGPCVRGLNLLR